MCASPEPNPEGSLQEIENIQHSPGLNELINEVIAQPIEIIDLDALNETLFQNNADVQGDPDALLLYQGIHNNSDDDSDYQPNISDESNDDETSESDADAANNTQEIANDIEMGEAEEGQTLKEKQRKELSSKIIHQQGVRTGRISLRDNYDSRQIKERCGHVLPKKKSDKWNFECYKLNEDQRQIIFQSFWNLGDISKQRDFILRNTKKVAKKDEHQKKQALEYSFHFDGYQLKICKCLFLSTIDVSEQMVKTAWKKLTLGGTVSAEGRGGCRPKNAEASVCKRNLVLKFLDCIPKVPGHYQRSTSNPDILYVEGFKKVSEIYQQFVATCMRENSAIIPKIAFFRKVFKSLHIKIHVPIKDVCLLCENFHKNKNPSQEETNTHKLHLDEKVSIRLIRRAAIDLQLNEEGSRIIYLNFDLQSVKQLPISPKNTFFYRRKLNTYNFTVVQPVKDSVKCHIWHEGIAKRGTNEICTFLYRDLEEINEELSAPSQIVMTSDACGGQNRNTIMVAMMSYVVENFINIDSVDLYFYVSGHSQQDSDNVHSVIQCALPEEIFTVHEFATAVRLARKSEQKYDVILHKTEDILDFKLLRTNLIPGVTKTSNGESVKWHNIRHIVIRKQNPKEMLFQYSTDGEYYSMPFVTRHCKTKRLSACNIHELKKAYLQPPGITSAKMKDFEFLMKSGAIPQIYHDFYEFLPTSEDAADRLGQPDAFEGEIE